MAKIGKLRPKHQHGEQHLYLRSIPKRAYDQHCLQVRSVRNKRKSHSVQIEGDNCLDFMRNVRRKQPQRNLSLGVNVRRSSTHIHCAGKANFCLLRIAIDVSKNIFRELQLRLQLSSIRLFPRSTKSEKEGTFLDF
jgi:hypothetical protein